MPDFKRISATRVVATPKAIESADWQKNDIVLPLAKDEVLVLGNCLLYTSPSPRDGLLSRMPSSA